MLQLNFGKIHLSKKTRWMHQANVSMFLTLCVQASKKTSEYASSYEAYEGWVVGVHVYVGKKNVSLMALWSPVLLGPL